MRRASNAGCRQIRDKEPSPCRYAFQHVGSWAGGRCCSAVSYEPIERQRNLPRPARIPPGVGGEGLLLMPAAIALASPCCEWQLLTAWAVIRGPHRPLTAAQAVRRRHEQISSQGVTDGLTTSLRGPSRVSVDPELKMVRPLIRAYRQCWATVSPSPCRPGLPYDVPLPPSENPAERHADASEVLREVLYTAVPAAVSGLFIAAAGRTCSVSLTGRS